MMLTATAANLPYTSDSLHASLLGLWISVLLRRRPMMAHINKLSRVIESTSLNTDSPDQTFMRVMPLP